MFYAEWKLNVDLLKQALQVLNFAPNVDLFASRVNHQFPKYVAYRPDPGAFAVNAFSLLWSDMKFYAFPPFCVIPRVLQKIAREQVQGVIVAPYWPSQPWFPKLINMLTETPGLLSARKNLLQLPDKNCLHRLQKSLQLILCKVSGKDSDTQAFQTKQRTSYICSSWRPATSRTHAHYIRRWKKFARRRGTDSVHLPLNEAVNFLAFLYRSGLNYSSICIARSALSCSLDTAGCDSFGRTT